MKIPKEYSCLAYWQQRYRALEPSLTYRAANETEHKIWQRAFRKKYRQCLGAMPTEDSPLNVRVLEEIVTERYIRRKIVYTADRYSSIPAYLFLPAGVNYPAPAVICPHGHGRGKADPAGISHTRPEKRHLRKYNYHYAEQFALAGYVTLAPDLRCFGERVDDPARVYGMVKIEEGDHWCDINFVLASLIGFNLLTLHVYDIGRAIDVLQSMKEVNGKRIGCVGLSQGGTTTLFSAAYHRRIKVAGISGYFNSWKAFPMASGQLCGSQIVPNLLSYGDHAEIAGLICPRPLFLEFGRQDPLFPIAAGRASYQRLKKIYKNAGAADRLEVEEFDGLHQFRGNRIFSFFNKWL